MADTVYIHDRLLVVSLKLLLLAIWNKFLKDCINAETIEELWPNLVYLLRLTPIDIDSYENDPVGYVRSIFDIAGGLNVPKNFALDFIETSISLYPE